jgi:hypothetical protein
MPTQFARIETYGHLQGALADQLDRDDLTTTIALFIQMAEAEMNRRLRHFKMVKKASAAGHADDPRVALPTDWLEARNIELDGIKLEYITPDMYDTLRQAQDRGESVPSEARYYTFYDSAFEIWPEPSEDYTMTMDYYQKIPPLADQESGTNWLLTLAPDAYYYGSLKHSAPYLKDDARIALWSKLYDDCLAGLQENSDKAMVSGSVLVRRQGVSF